MGGVVDVMLLGVGDVLADEREGTGDTDTLTRREGSLTTFPRPCGVLTTTLGLRVTRGDLVLGDQMISGFLVPSVASFEGSTTMNVTFSFGSAITTPTPIAGASPVTTMMPKTFRGFIITSLHLLTSASEEIRTPTYYASLRLAWLAAAYGD